MSAAWAQELLGHLLAPMDRAEPVDPSRTYRLLGARWYAQGLFVKDEKSGHSIKANTLYRVKAGDFVYNRLFAWKGSFAIAEADANDCHVSNEFPCFAVNRDRLDPSYLKWWFSRESAWFHALGLSSGATPTSRNRLKEAHLLGMKVPLPPLDEQRRIVARIEALAAKVDEAKTLRHAAEQEVVTLPRALLSHGKSKRTIRVGDFATLRPPDVVVDPLTEYHFAGVYSFGRGVFRGQRKLGSEFAYPRLTRLRAGNFVYPKLMAREGALGVVPPDCDGLAVSTEFPVFEIDEEVMLPEVVDTYFRSPDVWPALSGQSGGTNVRRRRINPKDFLNLQMPCPSREAQVVIRECISRTSSIGALQAETADELDAMLPAILDKAFNGEL